MIEIPIWFFTTAIFAAFGTGFGLGRYMKPTITQQDGHCLVPKENGYRSSIGIKKLYSDNKVADVTCVFIGEKKTCKLLNKKCIYIS